MEEINLGSGNNLIMTTSKLVTCHEVLTLVVNGKKSIPLDIKVQADFDNIPAEYHEVFLNMMTSKYCKAVSFGNIKVPDPAPLQTDKPAALRAASLAR
jgi:hypothetical protein